MTESDARRDPILAVVGDDDRFDHVRARATELAGELDATLILYDVDAGGRLLESPLPTAWSAEGEADQFGRRLDVNDLEALGRGPLADQVRRTREAGVEAWAWLPDDDDADALRRYAEGQSVSIVVVDASARELAADLPTRVEVVGGEDGDRDSGISGGDA